MSRYYSYLVFKVKVFVVYLDINNNWIQKKKSLTYSIPQNVLI